MKKEIVRQALLMQRKNRASHTKYTDEKLAKELGVDRTTIVKTRQEIRAELFSYLGREFIDYRVDVITRMIERLEKNWDDLEREKTRTNEKAVKTNDFDSHIGRQLSFCQIVHTQPTADQRVKIIKEQTKIEDRISKLVTIDLFKVVAPENPIPEPVPKN